MGDSRVVYTCNGDNLQESIDRALDNIFPPREIVFRDEGKIPSFDNAIEQRTVVVVGSQGSGKTTLFRSIVVEAIKRYGVDNVSNSYSKNIDSIIQKGIVPNYRVQILIADDINQRGSGVNQKTLEDFFKMRHKMKEVTGYRTGLVVLIIGTHNIFNSPRELRGTIDLYLFKDMPTNDYDVSWIRRKLTYSEFERFRQVEQLKQRDPSYKAFTFWSSKLECGDFIGYKVDYSILREIPSVKQEILDMRKKMTEPFYEKGGYQTLFVFLSLALFITLILF